MGTCAKVNKLALAVEADNSVFGKLLDELNLVGLVLFCHKCDSLCAGELKTLDAQVFAHDLLHFGFDILEDILGEGDLAVEVIVVAVVYCRTDGKLGLGVESLNSLSEDVGCGMAVNLLALFIGEGEKFDLVAFLDGSGHCRNNAVYLCGDVLAGNNACRRSGFKNRGCVFYRIIDSIDFYVHFISPIIMNFCI